MVYFGWYPEPLDALSGVGEILLMLLAIDVILGPMLTLVIFDRRKKSLPFDLACIAVVQLVALAYGLHTVEAGRPHFLVFVKDRFEVVSKADLQPQDREAGADNRAAESDILGPRVVAAEMPTSGEERNNILFEAVGGGRDVQHFPKLYRDYASQASLAAGKARPLAELRALNPDDKGLLRDTIGRSGLSESRLGFLADQGARRRCSDARGCLVGVDRRHGESAAVALAVCDRWKRNVRKRQPPATDVLPRAPGSRPAPLLERLKLLGRLVCTLAGRSRVAKQCFRSLRHRRRAEHPADHCDRIRPGLDHAPRVRRVDPPDRHHRPAQHPRRPQDLQRRAHAPSASCSTGTRSRTPGSPRTAPAPSPLPGPHSTTPRRSPPARPRPGPPARRRRRCRYAPHRRQAPAPAASRH